MKRIQFSESVFLNLIESDKFKTDYFEINLILPLREETASYAALLPQVLRRGSKKYPQMSDISKRFDYLYSTGFSARVTKRGENQIVSFTADFLRESLLPPGEHLMDDVFETMRSIIFEPLVNDGAFKAEYVESEKKNLIDAIKSIINNKNAYSMKKCHEAMCKGQNYAVSESGKVELVEKIDGTSLYNFYKDFLSHAKIEMFYTGTCDENVIKNHARSLISDIKSEKLYDLHSERFERTRDKVVEITEEMEVAQGKLVLCFRSGHTISDEKYSAYALFNNIFGGSPTSKLFENVREKLSLCYFCRSIPDAHKGILTVVSGIEVANRDKAQKEILAQLDNVKSGNISDEEMSSAKNDMINSYRSLCDSASDISTWYLSRLLGGSGKTIEDVIDEIGKVTKEDVVACAKATELDTIFFLKGTLTDGGEEE
ncbi:MAG: insulinase family protein [Ruminococcaceae bacterium]|nr:insulinase family protein [Oscillospiraceae bacterium]